MSEIRPALADQIHDLIGNEAYERLITEFQWELQDIELANQRGTITAAEYVTRKEAAGQGVELAIYELWRKETAHE